MQESSGIAAERSLVRALGVRALAATIFNVIVGGGIFGLPSEVAQGLGAAAPVAYVVCAIAMGLIVLCFAEAGSRVSLSGGPYAYVEVALGGLVGFLGGVLLWLVASFATAAVASVFMASVAAFVPAVGRGVGRTLLFLALFTFLAVINVRGVRQGTRLIEIVTIAKLLPLIAFVVVGAFFVDTSLLSWDRTPALGEIGATSVVLFFAFAGIESALVPSGEVKDPARTVPRALFIALGGVTVLYIAVQLVAQGLIGPALASESAPLTAAARRISAPFGVLLGLGAAISTFGHQSGMMLATPRALFAFGRDGILPRAFANVHPRFRTPYVAIITQAVVCATLAITASFGRLAVLATVSTLVLYLLCCIAAWVLRRRDVRVEGATPFRVPGGPVVPMLAVLVILWLLSSARAREYLIVGAVAAVAALVYVISGAHRARDARPT
ncbi:MAG: amino acid permease [Gemmatimonadota bacterium]|nr:amino acid permease [Gemmatimonadota bacterium]